MAGSERRIVESGKGLVDEHVAEVTARRGDRRAEENFAGEDAGEDEHLRFSEQMTAVSMPEYLRDGGDEKDYADGGQDDEGDCGGGACGKLDEGEFAAPRRSSA